MTVHSEEASLTSIGPELSFSSGPPILVTFKTTKTSITSIKLKPSSSFSYVIDGEGLKREIADWIESYLQRKEGKELPLDFSSVTPFMKQGLKAIQSIPFGETASYKEVATKAGNEKASRALGAVCNRNPYPLVIPCHRVIAHNGSPGGFAYGLDMKREMLEFEKTITARNIPVLN